jgi:hypothetical protein
MFAFTPDIQAEYFNSKWYEYTGLARNGAEGNENPMWRVCHPVRSRHTYGQLHIYNNMTILTERYIGGSSISGGSLASVYE